jgi:Flp pilus assembly protein TadG
MTCRQRGASIMEAAVVLPVFFLLLLAIFEFGLVISAYQTMVGAAREGARVAVIPDPTKGYILPTAGAVADVVCRKLQAGVFGPLSTCSNYPAGTPNATATCPPFAGGQPPKLTTNDVYVNTCSGTVLQGGTERYIQVAVHRTVQLLWGWSFPLSARAIMRSEAN